MKTETQLENLSSPVYMQTHAGSAYDNCITLTYDLLTSDQCMPSNCYAQYVHQVRC